ncbi:MAG TPA: hypothetical protein VGM19_11095 [Armatimonadota bacterium]
MPRSAGLYAALLAGVIYLLLALTPQISLGGGLADLLSSVGVTLIFTALSVALAVQVARWRLRPLLEVFGAVLAAGVWQGATALSDGPGTRLYLGPLANVAFILVCLLAGRLLSRLLRDRNILLPVAVVAILADIFTVAIGPTGRALQQAPELVEKFSVGLPQLGSAAGPQGAAGLAMLATMGVGDFVFLALFLTAAARFAFPLRRGALIIAPLVCLALLSYFALPLLGIVLPGVPLLPFIAGGFLLAYGRRFSLSPEEKRGLIWAGVLLVVLLGGAAWMMKAGPTPPSADLGHPSQSGRG